MTAVSIVVLAGYILLHFFSIIQTDRCLASFLRGKGSSGKLRLVWMAVYIVIFLLPVAGTFWPESPVKYTIMAIGNVTLGFDIYYCGFLLIFMAVRMIAGAVRNPRHRRSGSAARWTMAAALVLAVIIPVYAMIHAQRPQVTYWQADICGNGESRGSYRVVLLGDLHMSVNSSPRLIGKAVELANAEYPDAVFITGDFFTSNYEGLKDPELYIEELSRLSAKDGVIAVYGNHDVKENLFCGFAVSPVSRAFRPSEMEQFIKKCGIRVLEDEVMEIAGGDLLVAGRKDGSKAGDGTAERLSAEELLSGADEGKPVLVLEHEPEDYGELRHAGADIVFSGHTHNGQIWPCNLFIPLMTENAYGFMQAEGLSTFVTSGVGYFGPPQRSGTISEVMVIDILY